MLQRPPTESPLPEPASRRGPVFEWLLPLVLLGLLGVRRWIQMGPFAPGLDPGNWFAIGRGFFEEPGKSTEAAFPPLVPALMHLGRLVLPEMVLTKTIAVGSVLLIVLATYVAARRGMRLPVAVGASALVGVSSYINEVS